MESLKLTEDELNLAAFIIKESANTGEEETDAKLEVIAGKLKTQAILADVHHKAKIDQLKAHLISYDTAKGASS